MADNNLVCCICQESGVSLLDPHGNSVEEEKIPKHVVHATCLSTWQSVSNQYDRKCPYCRCHMRNDINACIIEAFKATLNELRCTIKENQLDEFKRICEGHPDIDKNVKRILATDATIMSRISFLEYMEKTMKYPTINLIPFLAIVLSMKSTTLKKWYFGLLRRKLPFHKKREVKVKFNEQLLIAAGMINDVGLIRYYRMKNIWTKSYLAETDEIRALAEQRNYSLIIKITNGYMLCREGEFVEKIVPVMVKHENKGQTRFWYWHGNMIYSKSILKAILLASVAAINYDGCLLALHSGVERRELDKFTFPKVQYLFGWRGKKWGVKILSTLHDFKLLDLDDLREHKIALCSSSYHADNLEMIQLLLRILGECLTAREMEKILKS